MYIYFNVIYLFQTLKILDYNTNTWTCLNFNIFPQAYKLKEYLETDTYGGSITSFLYLCCFQPRRYIFLVGLPEFGLFSDR